MDFCTKVFPHVPLQWITQMVGGIDVILYRPDQELKNHAKLALELKVESAIGKDIDVEDVIKALNGSSNGRKWIAAWDKAKYPCF